MRQVLLSNRYSLVLAIILILALSTSVAHAGGAVTINSVGLGEPDNFYSPADGNNIVHLTVNASGADRVIADFSTINGMNCDGVSGPPIINLTANGSIWTGVCNVTSAAAVSNFDIHGVIIIVAINNSGGPPPPPPGYVVNDTSLFIGLYNMTVPPEGGPCMHWDTSATTDLSKELDFNSVNYSVAPKINIACAMNVTFPPEAPPWLSNFTRLALINFTSLNMTANTTGQQLGALAMNMNVQITPPGQFGDSRIGFNTSALSEFNATSASVTLYHLPFTSPPAIFSDAGSNGEATNVNWTNDGNLTFTVNHFSGYNVTDNITPTISILSPTTNLSAPTVVVNVRVNGTMTPPSNITISGVPGGPYYYYNSTANTASCSNISADMETFDCMSGLGPIPLSDGTYNLTVVAKDYGGASGNTNQASFVFIKDATPPIVNLITPANNSLINHSNVSLSFNVSDNMFGSVNCMLWWNSSASGVGNQTLTSIPANGSTQSAGAVDDSDGVTQWYINCTDGVGNNGTSLTFVFTRDTIAPTRAFVSPTPDNNTVTNTTAVVINVTHTETHPDKISLYIDGVLNETRSYSGSFTNFTKTFTEGAHNFSVTLNDSVGNTNTTGISFVTIDLTAPNAAFIPPTPSNGSFAPAITVINVSHTETNPDKILLYVDGVLNETRSYSGTFTNFTKTFTEGAHNFSVTLNDTVNHTFSTNLTFITVDTIYPTVNFTSPTPVNGTLNTTNQTQIINVTNNDTNPSTLVFYVDGSAVRVMNWTPTFTNFSYTFTDGPHAYYVYVNDTAGNPNQTETRTVTIETTAPSASFVPPTPSNGTFVNTPTVVISVNITEANPDKILLYIDGALNYSGSYSGSGITNFTEVFTQGAHNFSVTLNDTANNTFSTNLTFITVDSIYPTIAFVSPTPNNNSATNITAVVINVSHTETNPVTLLLYIDGVLNDTRAYSGAFTNFTKTFVEGAHNFSVTLNDSAGNTNTTGTSFVTIDTTAPSASFVSPTPGNGSFVNAPAVVINVSQTEANPDKILLYIDGVLNETRAYSGAFTNFTKTFTQGAHNFSVTLNDTANNTFSTNLTFITVDSIYPTVAFVSPTLNTSTLTNNKTQIINVTNNDTNPSTLVFYVDGVANQTMSWTPTFTNFSYNFTDGNHSYYIYLNDSAGNANQTENRTISVDTVAPQVTANPSTYPAGQTYAKVGDVVTLNITATDGSGSGVKNATATGFGASQACGGDVALTNTGGNFWTGNCTIAGTAPEGSTTPSVYVYDNAGNLNNSVTVSILVDKTAPTIVFTSPTPSNNSLNTTNVQTINVTHTETNPATLLLYIDGVLNDTRAYSGAFTNFTKTFADGAHNFSVWLNDSAGNVNATGTSFVTIDTTAPAVTINSPTANSWYKKVNVTVNATITDMSSLSKKQYKITNSTGELVVNWTNLTLSSGYYGATFDATSATEGNYTLQINATDNNSFVNDSVTSLFWIDGTVPNITSFSLSATTAYTGDIITGTCAATDNLDTNVFTIVTGISTSSTGTKTATCTATDDAGNSVTSNVSYTINAQSTGGGGGGAPIPQATQTFASVATGATATMPVAVTGLAVSQIAITVENAATSVQVHIESVTTPTAGTPTLAIAGETGAVYSYMQITTTNLPNDNIASAKIRFTVSKSWLTQQGLNASDVSLFRLSGDWTQLTTTVLSEDTNNVYFEADTPGFSLFAVFASTLVTPTQFCVPSSKQCSGNDLQTCNVGGTAWQTTETCSYGCDTTTLACSTAPAEEPPAAPEAPPGETAPTPMPLETIAAIIVVLVIIGGFVYFKFFMSHGYHYKR